jgi:branched-chain amino acid transport system substrate-binding protein
MQKSRAKRVGALLVGLSLTAAACGSDSDDDSGDSEETESTEAVEEEGEGEETESTEAMEEEGEGEETESTEAMEEEGDGEEAAGGGSTEGQLVIGGLLPETGNLAFLGPPEIAGVNLAVEDINAAGGVLGNDVVYLPGDSGDNGEVANATVDRLLAEDVDAFIGAASSGVSFTVIDKITQAGKVHFSPANTSPDFTEYDDNDLYFRTAPSDIIQGDALAQTMIDDGVATVGYLVLNDAYGLGLLEFSKGPYEEQGGQVVLEQIYDPKAENFDAEVNAIVEANPDGIVVIGFEESAQILNGLIEAGFGPADKAVYGTDGNFGNALLANFDDPDVLAGMKGTLPGVDVAGEIEDFRDRLLEVDGGLEDFSYSAESYDAIVVMALAAIVAGSDDGVAVGAEINEITRGGEKCTTFEECLPLAEAGEDLDYDGVSGPLEFIDAGEPSEASILILEFDAEGDGIDFRTTDAGDEVADDVDVIGSIAGTL